MKYAINIILFLAFIANSEAQTSLGGIAIRNDLPRQNGVYGWWKADHGVFTTGTGNTNVQYWCDMSGNQFTLNQFTSSLQPSFNPVFGTNAFPAVVFNAETANQHLKCDPFATAFSGEDKPFTIIGLYYSQTNGQGVTAVSFGWSATTNNNAAAIIVTPNRVTVTQSGFNHSSNTNQSLTATPIFGTTASITTQQAFIVSCLYDGTTGRVFQNLAASSVQNLDQTTLTTDQFTIGCHRRLNSGTVFGWFGGIVELQIYTNQLTGTQVTNLVNDINSRYRVY